MLPKSELVAISLKTFSQLSEAQSSLPFDFKEQLYLLYFINFKDGF
jgi:hypothetical protein